MVACRECRLKGRAATVIWTLRVSFVLFLAWVLFIISPFVALYDLGKAIEGRNVARIDERVNFHALRTSLSRQIVDDYMKTPDGQMELTDIHRQLAVDAGSKAFAPRIEELVTPYALADLLEEGRRLGAGGAGSGLPFPVSLSFGSAKQAWKLFINAQTQGFRSISMSLPAQEPKERQFRVTLRLSGSTWRLTGLDLPQALREDLLTRRARDAD
ncbi:DUF2939 domain-containing protein [Microvirga terricola]|uniref:DUF2939 domain-containing protein n=1 Tax=Microvirga terricola TaxID=2719797 RepID=A0ABX0VCJ9_9HYPH|nr:DUF2939 domain-containing protein [Microvirga terricola]NIX76879.1 DUF2939 domain-containing protein [Microvirga terricola]